MVFWRFFLFLGMGSSAFAWKNFADFLKNPPRQQNVSIYLRSQQDCFRCCFCCRTCSPCAQWQERIGSKAEQLMGKLAGFSGEKRDWGKLSTRLKEAAEEGDDTLLQSSSQFYHAVFGRPYEPTTVEMLEFLDCILRRVEWNAARVDQFIDCFQVPLRLPFLPSDSFSLTGEWYSVSAIATIVPVLEESDRLHLDGVRDSLTEELLDGSDKKR